MGFGSFFGGQRPPYFLLPPMTFILSLTAMPLFDLGQAAEPLPEIGEGFDHAVFTGDLYEKGLTCGCQE